MNQNQNENENENQVDRTKPNTQPSHSSEYAPYSKLDPNDVAPSTHDWTASGNSATTMPLESNPCLTPSPVPDSSMKNTLDSVKEVLGKWEKKHLRRPRWLRILLGICGST